MEFEDNKGSVFTVPWKQERNAIDNIGYKSPDPPVGLKKKICNRKGQN